MRSLARALWGLAPWLWLCGLGAAPAAADWTASGRFQYTDRLYDINGFTGTSIRPVREADVQVFDLNTQAVLASGATDANGDFSLFVVDATTRDVGVRVLARSDETPTLEVSILDDLSASRRAFNAHVKAMNDLVEQFPTFLVAQATGFARMRYFEINAAAREHPGPLAGAPR